MSNMVHCQLWMGGLEPYMTESFILASFQRMGEKPLNVKVMRNKFTGEPAGYCFVHFENDEEAIDAMHKLNGKVIPNTSPAVRFRLNTATNQGKIVMNEREFSLWVGDLTSDVDDYTLYKCFAAKYTSIKAAKVILDAAGHSKGFGFLRFGLEDEQKHCIVHMNGYKGLGLKPLKISNAIPKNQRNASSSNGTTNLLANIQLPVPDYSQYYQEASYWQNYSQWGYGYDANSSNYGYDTNQYNQQYGSQYNQQYPQQQQQQYGQQYSQQYPQYSQQQQYSQYYQQPATQSQQLQAATISASTTVPTSISQPTVDDSIEVVDHSAPIDVDKENREYSESVLSFWDEVASVGYTNPEFYEMEVARLKVSGISLPN